MQITFANPLNSLVRAMWYISIVLVSTAFLSNGRHCTHSNDNTTFSDRSLPNTEIYQLFSGVASIEATEATASVKKITA